MRLAFAIGLNVFFMMLLRCVVSKMNIFKDNFSIGPKINFVTMNFYQVIITILFVIVYILSFLSVNTSHISFLTEFIIVSMCFKMFYEYSLTINPDRSITNNIVSYDLNIPYKVSTIATIIILYMFATELQCLNEMLNFIVMTIGSLYDINMLFETEYVVIGFDRNAGVGGFFGQTTFGQTFGKTFGRVLVEKSGNETLLNKICQYIQPHIIKIYISSIIFDILSAIYYKFFTKEFQYFFLYKIFVLISIAVKIFRVCTSFDPSSSRFESSSVKHLKKWTRIQEV